MALRTIYINIKGKIIEKIVGAVFTENNFTDTEKQKLANLTGITSPPQEASGNGYFPQGW